MLALSCALSLMALGAPDAQPLPSEPPPRAALPHHPHDIVHALGVPPGYPADPRLFVASQGSINLFLVSEDKGQTWTESRSGMRGHRARAIEFASDFAASQRVYVVMEDLGLQISEDGGTTWQVPRVLRKFRTLAVAPVGADGRRVLMAATWNVAFISEDDGRTDRRLAVPSGSEQITSLAFSPAFASDDTLAVTTAAGGLHISGDGGKRWRSSRLPDSIRHIEFSPDFATDRTMWIATFGGGVRCSTDAGETFGPAGMGLTDLDVNQVRAARNGDRFDLFAATRSDGVFHSADGGATWTRKPLEVKKTYQTDNHHTIVRISPAWPEDRTVWCGTFEGLYLSSDGGATWHESNINPPRMGRMLAISPHYADDGSVFAAGYGMHVMVSADRGESWDLRFQNFAAGSVYALAPSPRFADGQVLLAGIGKGFRRSMDSGLTWKFVPAPPHPDQFTPDGSGGYTMKAVAYAPDFAESRVVFAVSSRGILYRSSDAGLSWTPSEPISKWTSAVQLSTRFPSDSTLYVGGTNVYRSTDGGVTFGEPILQDEVVGDGLVVPPDFADTGELYCITRDRGFVRFTERGDRWEASNDGLEDFRPSVLQLSPRFVEDGRIFVATAGGGLFSSSDRGQTWSRIESADNAVEHGISMVISPEFDEDGTIFVGTFDGFHRTRDGGRTWTALTHSEIYDDLRDPWQAVGTWKEIAGDGAINWSVTTSGTPGDKMTLPFHGTGCRVFGSTGPNHGTAVIRIDGEIRATVSCYSERPAQRVLLGEFLNLGAQSHVLEITVGEQRPEGSSGLAVGIDAAEVVFE